MAEYHTKVTCPLQCGQSLETQELEKHQVQITRAFGRKRELNRHSGLSLQIEVAYLAMIAIVWLQPGC